VPGRAVTVVAVGFLLLDAVLLAAAGVWTDRPALIGWGAAFVLAAGGVIVLRRRHARSLAEIARARALLRQELRSVRAPGREDPVS
jgi:hypothetical protein